MSLLLYSRDQSEASIEVTWLILTNQKLVLLSTHVTGGGGGCVPTTPGSRWPSVWARWGRWPAWHWWWSCSPGSSLAPPLPGTWTSRQLWCQDKQRGFIAVLSQIIQNFHKWTKLFRILYKIDTHIFPNQTLYLVKFPDRIFFNYSNS